MTKVLSNLLTNANKYTQSRIEVRFQEHPEKQTFSIEVKDNGKGMNEEELKKIFKPFYQASENKPGTGIGLSIVKGIVEAHHGQIKVTSQQGHGSSFMITLPQNRKTYQLKRKKIRQAIRFRKILSQSRMPQLPCRRRYSPSC